MTAPHITRAKHAADALAFVSRIRCYDNGGKTADRYTVCYPAVRDPESASGAYHPYVGMSADPFAPQGVCQHGDTVQPIDWPRSRHLGTAITIDELPIDCQQVIKQDTQPECAP